MLEIIKKTVFDINISAENRRFDIIGGRVICWTRAKSPGANKVFIFSVTETGTRIDFQTSESEDRGTPPIIARKRGIVLLLLNEEFIMIKMKSFKITRTVMPREIDHGPGADIESVNVSRDERYASFIYKTYNDMIIYVVNLNDSLTLTSV